MQSTEACAKHSNPRWLGHSNCRFWDNGALGNKMVTAKNGRPRRSGLSYYKYCTTAYLLADKPPTLHDRQMPNVLPLPMMFVQRLVMLASSCALRVA